MRKIEVAVEERIWSLSSMFGTDPAILKRLRSLARDAFFFNVFGLSLAFRIVAITLSIAFLAACSRTSRLHAEIAEQKAATSATLDWLEKEYDFVDSAAPLAYVQSVADRLAAVFPEADSICQQSFSLKRESEQRSGAWKVLLLKDGAANAFSLGSQTIILSTGLAASLESEGELAAILSHEMSHELLGHVNETETLSDHQPLALLSLDQELEADAYGLCLLQAGRFSTLGAIVSLSIGYRREKGVVSENDWLTRRLQEMQQRIVKLPKVGNPAQNNRGFKRFQRELALVSNR